MITNIYIYRTWFKTFEHLAQTTQKWEVIKPNTDRLYSQVLNNIINMHIYLWWLWKYIFKQTQMRERFTDANACVRWFGISFILLIVPRLISWADRYIDSKVYSSKLSRSLCTMFLLPCFASSSWTYLNILVNLLNHTSPECLCVIEVNLWLRRCNFSSLLSLTHCRCYYLFNHPPTHTSRRNYI